MTRLGAPGGPPSGGRVHGSAVRGSAVRARLTRLPRPSFADLLPSGVQWRLRACLLGATAGLGAVAVLSRPNAGTDIPAGLAVLAAAVALVVPGASTSFGIVFGLGLALGNALPHHGLELAFAAPAAAALWLVVRLAALACALPATVEVVPGTVSAALLVALPSVGLPGLIGLSAVLAEHPHQPHPALRVGGLCALAVLALLPLLAQTLRRRAGNEV